MTEQNLPSIDVVLDEVRRRQEFQFSQLDTINTKAGIVLGVDGVLFTILITLLATNLFGQASGVAHLSLVKIALIPILVSIILSYVPIYVRTWDLSPDVGYLRDHYIVEDIEETKLKIIDTSLKTIEDNQKRLKRLFRLINLAYFFLAVGLVLLLIWIWIIIW